MKRNVIETILGAVVLLLAGSFLVFSYKTANLKKVSGYEIEASFSNTGGLSVGDLVQIAGVKAGTVSNISLEPETFLAIVKFDVAQDIKLPKDTIALISSEGLLGGKYLELQPGAEEKYIMPGERIRYTQSPQNLEQLLGKFIFSMQKGNDEEKAAPEVETP